MDACPHPLHYLSFSSVLFWEDEITQMDSYPDSLTEIWFSEHQQNRLQAEYYLQLCNSIDSMFVSFLSWL